VPGALQGLHSSKASERNRALQVLGRCGERSAGAVPVIASLMYDDNVGVASSAAYALRRIDTPAARKALRDAEGARERRAVTGQGR